MITKPTIKLVAFLVLTLSVLAIISATLSGMTAYIVAGVVLFVLIAVAGPFVVGTIRPHSRAAEIREAREGRRLTPTHR